jgi:hypothetical protein
LVAALAAKCLSQAVDLGDQAVKIKYLTWCLAKEACLGKQPNKSSLADSNLTLNLEQKSILIFMP